MRDDSAAAARDRERFIERVMMVAPGVTSVYDVIEGRSVFVSEGVLPMLGRSSAEIAAMDDRVVQRLMHPDDIVRFPAHLARLDSEGDGKVLAFEHRMRHADGRWVWVQSRDTVFERTPEGRLQRIIGLAVDVTDAQQAARELARREREFWTLSQNSPDVIARFGRDLRHRYVSPAITPYTGLAPQEMIGRSNAELGMPPAACAQWDGALGRVFASGRPMRILFEFVDVEGRARHFDSRLTPEFGENGEVESVLTVATDITERVIAENALREADRQKDRFLATLAHELRNPLAPILNSLEVMRQAQDPAVVDASRRVIERQVAQLVHLVDDLLDVSRVSLGKLRLRRERLDLAAAISRAVETCRPACLQRGHRLTLDVEPGLWVDADATRLAQALTNALGNAAKFTPDGGSVELVARREGDELVVRITDTGIGIAPEALPLAFEMFNQLGPSHGGDRDSGLGIGLALVKRIAELHGGSVALASEGVGRGATVTLRLPAAGSSVTPSNAPDEDATAADSEPASRDAAGPPAPAAASARKPKVLVADDDDDGLASMAMLLEMLGCDTATASDGVEAIEVASRFEPDIALLDIGMPLLDGLATARRMRREHWGRQMLLVALTGWGQPDDRRRTLDAGFDHHLVKPVDPSRLMALIESRRPRG